MDTLDLIRKLYDENADPAELEQGLDEERLADLRRLVEAKEALDALPPRRPSTASLEAITARATQAPGRKRSRLALIISPRFVQSVAAAAAIVMAVGIGYLTVKSPYFNIESVDTELAENETRRDRSAGEEIGEDLPDAEKPASNLPGRSNIESAPASARLFEADAVITSQEGIADMKAKDELADAMSPTEESYSEYGDDSDKESNREPSDNLFGDSVSARKVEGLDDYSQPGGRAGLVGAIMAADLDTVAWDDQAEFQTFYWQVQALGERSPDDEWEEAVPLEGSFRNLDSTRRDPAWLEAKSEQ